MHSRREISFFLWIPSMRRFSYPSIYRPVKGKEQDDSSRRDPEEMVDMQKEILWQIVSQDILGAICFAL